MNPWISPGPPVAAVHNVELLEVVGGPQGAKNDNVELQMGTKKQQRMGNTRLKTGT